MSKRSNKWCLIGIPDHQGVANVGGRLGASSGPKAFRQAFAKLAGRDNVHETLVDEKDLSPILADLAACHRAAADRIRAAHARTGLSVVVGGGHDHGFPHLLGLREALGAGTLLGCINLDAHLDVRKPDPLITSGSPFYLALESGVLSADRLVEFGIQLHCNRKALWDYVEARKVKVVPYSQLRNGRAADVFATVLAELATRCDAIAISLDLDSAASAYAPGVSAPQSEGFSSGEIIEMMELSGRHPKVASLGVFELNPEHDADERTSRLAATAVYHFIAEALRARTAQAALVESSSSAAATDVS